MSCDDDYDDCYQNLTKEERIDQFLSFRYEFYRVLEKIREIDPWYKLNDYRNKSGRVSLLSCAHRIYECTEGRTFNTQTKIPELQLFDYDKVLTDREATILFQYALKYILLESTVGYNENCLPTSLEK